MKFREDEDSLLERLSHKVRCRRMAVYKLQHVVAILQSFTCVSQLKLRLCRAYHKNNDLVERARLLLESVDDRRQPLPIKCPCFFWLAKLIEARRFYARSSACMSFLLRSRCKKLIGDCLCSLKLRHSLMKAFFYIIEITKAEMALKQPRLCIHSVVQVADCLDRLRFGCFQIPFVLQHGDQQSMSIGCLDATFCSCTHGGSG